MVTREDIDTPRKEYRHAVLREEQVHRSPFVQFARWFEEAKQSRLPEPNAMALATVSGGGQPSLRTVLLKEMTSDGFIFFTNYRSRKGQEIGVNAKVALLFFWAELERQVRIEGVASAISRESSEAYFHSRPRDAQLGSAVSLQSEVIANRAVLDERYARAEQELEGRDIPCPRHWGGYLVRPLSFEFWQGGTHRLHDRLLYVPAAGGDTWTITRLAP